MHSLFTLQLKATSDVQKECKEVYVNQILVDTSHSFFLQMFNYEFEKNERKKVAHTNIYIGIESLLLSDQMVN